MKMVILDLICFLGGGLFREGGLQSQLPQGTQAPFCSLLGCDFPILGGRGGKDYVLRVGSKVLIVFPLFT